MGVLTALKNAISTTFQTHKVKNLTAIPNALTCKKTTCAMPPIGLITKIRNALLPKHKNFGNV
jgi:hypothetical protein